MVSNGEIGAWEEKKRMYDSKEAGIRV